MSRSIGRSTIRSSPSWSVPYAWETPSRRIEASSGLLVTGGGGQVDRLDDPHHPGQARRCGLHIVQREDEVHHRPQQADQVQRGRGDQTDRRAAHVDHDVAQHEHQGDREVLRPHHDLHQAGHEGHHAHAEHDGRLREDGDVTGLATFDAVGVDGGDAVDGREQALGAGTHRDALAPVDGGGPLQVPQGADQVHRHHEHHQEQQPGGERHHADQGHRDVEAHLDQVRDHVVRPRGR